jgi:hypothetical protein
VLALVAEGSQPDRHPPVRHRAHHGRTYQRSSSARPQHRSRLHRRVLAAAACATGPKHNSFPASSPGGSDQHRGRRSCPLPMEAGIWVAAARSATPQGTSQLSRGCACRSDIGGGSVPLGH